MSDEIFKALRSYKATEETAKKFAERLREDKRRADEYEREQRLLARKQRYYVFDI